MSHSLIDFLRTAGGPSPDRAEALWVRYRETDDEAAFTTLVGWYGSGIYRRILIATGFDHLLAEEVFQTTLFKLHERRKVLACPTFTAALAWWRVTARNEVQMALRGRRRARAREERVARNPAIDATPGAETEVLRAELLTELGTAFSRLRPEHRETLSLLYFENLPVSRAAAILGRNRETVSRWAEQGLSCLRDLLAARGVLSAAGGVAAARLVLTDAVQAAVPTVRIAEFATAAWTAKPAGTSFLAAGWVKKVAGVLGVVAFGCVVAIGWQLERSEPPAPSLPNPPAARAEDIPQRNLHLFHLVVTPRIRAALADLLTGDGDVVLEAVETYDTRIFCTFSFKHKLPTPLTWVPRVRFIYEAHGQTFQSSFDLHEWEYDTPEFNPIFIPESEGRIWDRQTFLEIDRRRPDLPKGARPRWRNPTTERTWPVDSIRGVLTRVESAFRLIPADRETAAEKAATDDRLKAAIRPHLGIWYGRGRQDLPCELSDSPDGLVLKRGYNWSRTVKKVPAPAVCGNWWVRVRSDGAPSGLFTWGLTVRFSPDGRRINFPESGDWWTREPIPEPQKQRPDKP
ncbi:RNA polymerase sigma factor [Fimbriiglobus ruber]|uniref:High-affnity carbon uptake protein Hat/HatR n=1 Tax=Fimbriiglobus ruber TaxID=1908690 RepID=A0A225DU42_9BACT|nr:sigma-70 family RNA polymerase sigma factor [Fimbriiglobus ruber]OWK39895.1 High-affnity carbon uptake protein Hat/HatR [Fimbriiglobus ruber]